MGLRSARKEYNSKMFHLRAGPILETIILVAKNNKFKYLENNCIFFKYLVEQFLGGLHHCPS